MNRINQLQVQLKRGQLSRREFMKRATALGIAATTAASLCSGAAHAANKGGRLRVGMAHGSTTDTLDPATTENSLMTLLTYGIHNHVAEVGSSGKLEPEIAESWEASPDAKEWTFNIRKDVEFHNGKTMDADDVVASVNHHRHEDSHSAARALLTAITEIKAQGKDTVKVTLDGGNADFPFIISDYHIAILPSKDGKLLDAASGVGAGPYVVEQFEPGVRFFGKKHANYWKSDRGHFDEFEILSLVDVSARTNALKTGEVDVIDRVDLKTVHLLEKTPGIKVEEKTGYAHYTIPMRTDTAPFDDNHVRMALKLGLDREALLKTVLRGYGVVGNDHPISPANQFHASELPQRTYDPDKAKWHLQQIGLDSLTVDLSAADVAFAGAVDAAVLYREHAAKAGITINVVREPNDGYWSSVWMKKPWCMCYWGGRPTEDWMFSTTYSEGAAWNDTFWKHDRFNQLLIQARAELDENLRREMYVEMQTILRDEGGVVLPLFNNYVFATADKVQHGEVQGNWDLDGMKLSERWWFA